MKEVLYEKKHFDKTLMQSFKNKFFKKILYIKKSENPLQLFAEVVGLLVLIFLTLKGFNNRLSIENPHGASSGLLHLINLVFHEAGHVLFIPFGIFIMKLGGTLMQCLVPLVLMIHFLRDRSHFSASVMFWWFGQNFLDIAPYIFDAQRLSLTLIGGGTGRDDPDFHDWFWLLNKMGVREHCESIALFVEKLGFLILLLAIVWAGLLIYERILKEFPQLVRH